MSDAEKRGRADHIIRSDTLEDARATVAHLVAELGGTTNA
jgi:hypothetical protein